MIYKNSHAYEKNVDPILIKQRLKIQFCSTGITVITEIKL